MSGGVKLHRHRPERDRDCSKNLVPPSALRARSVFPAIWAGQRNLRSSRTRDFKSSASTVVSVGIRNTTRRGATRNADAAICHVERSREISRYFRDLRRLKEQY